jgi:hypothetical protein
MNAFVLIHFGLQKKYLELEIYFLIMLKKNTKNDIIYLYSKNDTPKEYIKVIKKLNICKLKSYNDDNITYNIKDFKSNYEHFNTLRTCNFIFAYKLIEYEKICIIESDMIIMENIDDIFLNNCPAVYFYNNDINKINENYKSDYNKKNILQDCKNKSPINGGIMLFKPSNNKYKKYKKNIKIIIENNCIFPNEILFIYTENNIYNCPIKYNYSHYYVNKIYIKDIKIYHFNGSVYKPLNVIKDNYLDNKTKLYDIILYFKKKYYDKYNVKIEKKLKNIT